jgi:hypothetical protein
MADRMEEDLRKIEPEVKTEYMMQYYIQHRDEFHRDGKQLTRHLMIKRDDEKRDTLANEIWSLILDGEDFGGLIRKYSQSESQNRDGYLGWQPKGVLHQTMENVIWNMDIHEITGPIDIEGNLHYIQLMEKQERGLMDFEESKPHILDVLKEQERMKQIYRTLDIPKETIEIGNVESSVDYQTKLLEQAYKMHLDENAGIAKHVQVYDLYKRADLLFQNYVTQFESTIKLDSDQENGWRLESKALETLMNDMNFYFLVDFELPEKEANNA